MARDVHWTQRRGHERVPPDHRVSSILFGGVRQRRLHGVTIMNRLRCLLIACVLAPCWVLATGMRPAEAGTVVFGNFGPNGNLANSTTVSFQVGLAPGPTNQALAIPFQAGTNPLFLQLQSVTFSFGQALPDTNPSIGIFTNNSGSPGTLLEALSGPQVVGTQKYEWSPESLLQLDPGGQYFVVVQELNATSGFNWYMADEELPATQNNSGWFRPFAPRKSTNGGATWVNATVSEQNVGISFVAVPEPSSMTLAAAGLVAAACLCSRRSSRRTTAALS